MRQLRVKQKMNLEGILNTKLNSKNAEGEF